MVFIYRKFGIEIHFQIGDTQNVYFMLRFCVCISEITYFVFFINLLANRFFFYCLLEGIGINVVCLVCHTNGNDRKPKVEVAYEKTWRTRDWVLMLRRTSKMGAREWKSICYKGCVLKYRYFVTIVYRNDEIFNNFSKNQSGLKFKHTFHSL